MRRVALFTLLLGVSCGGGTCGGCVDAEYRFPVDQPDRPDAVIQQEVVRTRITQDFLDFIKPQLPDLIIAQAGELGDGVVVDDLGFIRIALPDQDVFDFFVAEAELRDVEAALFIEDLDTRVDLRLDENDGIVLELNDLRLGINAKLKTEVIGSDASCPITGGLGSGNRHAAEVSVRATINPGVGARPDYNIDIDVDVGNIDLTDLAVDARSSSVFCAEPECQDCVEIPGIGCIDPPCTECEIFCGVVANGLAELASALSGFITPLINDLLTPLIDDLVSDAVAAIDGTPARVETQLSITDLVDFDLLRGTQPLGLLAAPRPGRLSVNDRGAGLGLELTFDAGFEAPAAECVGDIEPFVPIKGPVPTLSGIDSNGEPYHLGLTVSASTLNQALHTAHRGGILCLRLTTEEVRELTGGAFTLNASLLSLLASDLGKLADPAAPAIVELKPRNAATVELGTGEQTGVDGDGNPTFDWLLQLRLDDVGVAFHVLIQDRFVRVFEVTTDVFIGANLSIQPDNTLQIALGELRIEEFSETFNELVPNANFAQILPTILDIALGALLDQSLVFDVDLTTTVSDALGGIPVSLRINELFRDGVQDDYLTLSATFSTTDQVADLRAVATTARLHEAEPGLIERVRRGDQWQAQPSGAVRLVVGERLSSEQRRDLEHQVRVDGGLWSIWRSAAADGTLVARDARLMMPGWHLIEVRSRLRGDYTTTDASPARVRALVDPIAPRLSATLGRDGVQIRVRDEESADVSGLVAQFRTSADSTWRPVSLESEAEGIARATVAYATIGEVESVELRARDASGNPSAVVSLSLNVPPEPLPVDEGPSATESSSCRSLFPYDDGTSSLHLSWLILGLGLLALRRRR